MLMRYRGKPKRVLGGLVVLSSLGIAAMVTAGCASFNPPLPVVESVDLERYAGKWYEIASYPNSFQSGCEETTAVYTPRDDGKITVLNTCREAESRQLRDIEGTARVVDRTTNAKLKVSFFWPFEGDYWIIDLAEDYSYAVVSEPGRRFLWILSRTPTMDDATYEDILAFVAERGLDPDRLVRTRQVAE